jgi:hypothetical protein
MKLQAGLFAAAIGCTVGVVGFTLPANAWTLTADTFAKAGGFSFDKDTTVDFNFIGSYGGYKSRFGVFTGQHDAHPTWLFTENLNRDPITGSNRYLDSQGTCPTSVTPCSNRFTFKAHQTYLLGLANIPLGGEVFSDDRITATDPKGFKFFQKTSASDPNPTYPIRFKPPFGKDFVPLPLDTESVAIFVNDAWAGDLDANDFIVTAKAAHPPVDVPEPMAMLGLGAIAGSFFLGRRRN